MDSVPLLQHVNQRARLGGKRLMAMMRLALSLGYAFRIAYQCIKDLIE